MVTYGKKKRFALPKFRSSSSKDHKQVATQPGPARVECESQIGVEAKPEPSPQDDSIDELASMLLDDTTLDQMKADPGKRLSRISMASSPPDQESKALPRLPGLLFNGDDAWALKTSSVVTAAGSANKMQFDDASEAMDAPDASHRPSNHNRNGSAPPIPRKSSKRRSSRPVNLSMRPQTSTITRKAIPKSASTPNHLTALSQPVQRPSIDAKELNTKIQQMLDATAALKGNKMGVVLQDATSAFGEIREESAVLPGPLVSTKKRLRDNKVLSRVKTVISDRLQSRSSKKHHDPVRDDLLLDNEFNDIDDSGSAISSVEIGANERKNLRTKSKSTALTGCKVYPRKPIQDDQGLRRNSMMTDKAFSLKPTFSLGKLADAEMLDEMSVGQNEDAIPHFPSTPSTKNQYHDFDDLLSSSPVAQSTPRMRLEPYYDDCGKKTLKNVPADSHSLFDNSDVGHYSDMEVDDEPADFIRPRSHTVGMFDTVKRKSSQLKAPSLGFESYQLKRAKKVPFSSEGELKKHPSPSKDELDELDIAMRQYNSSGLSTGLGQTPTLSVLAPINPNGQIGGWRQAAKGGISRASESMPNMTGNRRGRNLSSSDNMATLSNMSSSRAKKGHSRQRSRQRYVEDDSMDLDELQLDDPAYDIGMGRL